MRVELQMLINRCSRRREVAYDSLCQPARHGRKGQTRFAGEGSPRNTLVRAAPVCPGRIRPYSKEEKYGDRVCLLATPEGDYRKEMLGLRTGLVVAR